MSNPSRNLGRGLSALISSGLQRNPGTTAEAGPPRSLPLTSIQAGPSQPRRTMEQQPLEELAASIAANGVIQPILVRSLSSAGSGAPMYEIVAGERRWRAAKLAGLTDIPVVVRELSDQEAVAIALVENVQREDLTPAEEARALQRLVGDFELTHQAVADAVGRSRAAVSNLIRLLDLPGEVVALVDSKVLGMGHARALLGLDDDADRVRLAGSVVERNLSVRATEALVRKTLEGKGRAAPVTPPELSVVSEVLRTPDVRIQLQQKSAGGGKLIVEFADPDSRDTIIAAIKTAISP
jgi:ParB family transcriptional regulator, chromosome partitioning protein